MAIEVQFSIAHRSEGFNIIIHLRIIIGSSYVINLISISVGECDCQKILNAVNIVQPLASDSVSIRPDARELSPEPTAIHVEMKKVWRDQSGKQLNSNYDDPSSGALTWACRATVVSNSSAAASSCERFKLQRDEYVTLQFHRYQLSWVPQYRVSFTEARYQSQEHIESIQITMQ